MKKRVTDSTSRPIVGESSRDFRHLFEISPWMLGRLKICYASGGLSQNLRSSSDMLRAELPPVVVRCVEDMHVR